ncbi:MAG: hypothetical protein IKW30_07955 [Lachnospiraceae bacterium]|nr:hypothetical protein [Lachnospiraceae bacterium]
MKNTDSLRDEIRMQHEKLSQEPFSKKLEYFWDYYKLHVIITVFLACMFGSILHGIITKKETVLSIALINAFPNVEDEVMMEDLANYLNLNSKKQQILLDSTYYIDEASTSPYATTYSQKFSTNAMAGKLDVVLADSVNFMFYGNQGFFQDLSQLIPQKDLDTYGDRLYYADHPYDESSDLVPIGIRIDQVDKIQETSCYPGTDAYFGILTDTEHIDNALLYLKYLEQ